MQETDDPKRKIIQFLGAYMSQHASEFWARKFHTLEEAQEFMRDALPGNTKLPRGKKNAFRADPQFRKMVDMERQASGYKKVRRKLPVGGYAVSYVRWINVKSYLDDGYELCDENMD